MTYFSNINLDYENVTFGHQPGLVYSVDHSNNIFTVRTYPTGSLVSTHPLIGSIQNEVIEIEFDGYYYWTLSKLGVLGNLGVVINKWYFDGIRLIKRLGVGNEINLINTSSMTYESEAFCVHRYRTRLTSFGSIGSTFVTLESVEHLQVGDPIYLGPSSAQAGERIERVVSGISGNTVILNSPLDVQFNINDAAIYRKNIWIFNDKNFMSDEGGSLIQIDSKNGNIKSRFSSTVWKHVTTAEVEGGDLIFIRGSQLLKYRVLGVNLGFQSSMLLNNTKTDNNTIIKVFDMMSDGLIIYKLQQERKIFDSTLPGWLDQQPEITNKYNIDEEVIAPAIRSITTVRENKSVIFGHNSEADFTIKVRDQYNLPIFNRSLSVTEDDPSGFIPTGYTSITTDSLGEGQTKYNSGFSPEFRQVNLTVTDVITNQFLTSRIVQRPRQEDVGFLDQRDLRPSTLPLIQTVPNKGINFIEQYATRRNRIPLEQSAEKRNIIPLTQFIGSNTSPLLQRAPAINSKPLTQYGRINAQALCTQYEFLLFAIPTPYSVKNSVETSVLVRIAAFGVSELDPGTLTFKVKGVDVTNQVQITPFPGGLELNYHPDKNFNYSDRISIEITIRDNNIPPRTIYTFYTFDTVNDFRRPEVIEVFPPHKSIENSIDTNIYCKIKDLETGLNLDTIQMYVNGNKISHNIEQLDSQTVKIECIPGNKFNYDSNVIVGVYIEDLEGNRLLNSWDFYTKPSQGVLYKSIDPSECSVLVPLDQDICIEAFGLEDGINLDTATIEVLGKKVNYVLKSKVYRRK